MKILVTGATGNVGFFVVRHLTELGETVVAAGTNREKLTKTFQNQIGCVSLDLSNPADFDTAFEEVDRVFLMRPPQMGEPKQLYPFIDAAKKYQIKLLCFLSLLGVENNPIPPHHKIEKYIEASGIPYCHIRPGFFMQNLSGIHAKEIKERGEIFVPAGESKTNFIDTQDVGLAAAMVLHDYHTHQGRAYSIIGREALNYDDIADILTQVTGKKVGYAKPGLLKYRSEYIKKRKLDRKFVNVTVMLYIMTRLQSDKTFVNDFQLLTGKEPRTFEQFARDNIDAFL